MSVTVEKALLLLHEVYYGEGYGENHDPDEYDSELWRKLSWTLGRKGQNIREYTITCVEDFGGEGQGDTRFVVFAIVDNENQTTQYFRKDGHYVSYDGSTWDGEFREVQAKEKMVTFYE